MTHIHIIKLDATAKNPFFKNSFYVGFKASNMCQPCHIQKIWLTQQQKCRRCCWKANEKKKTIYLHQFLFYFPFYKQKLSSVILFCYMNYNFINISRPTLANDNWMKFHGKSFIHFLKLSFCLCHLHQFVDKIDSRIKILKKLLKSFMNDHFFNLARESVSLSHLKSLL